MMYLVKKALNGFFFMSRVISKRGLRINSKKIRRHVYFVYRKGKSKRILHKGFIK